MGMVQYLHKLDPGMTIEIRKLVFHQRKFVFNQHKWFHRRCNGDSRKSVI